jgi:hypothetical protein
MHGDEGRVRMADAFLFLVKENLARSVLDRYPDDPEVSYAWDETVPNHRLPRPGDAVILWSERGALGISIIEEIESSTSTKMTARCPICSKKQVRDRSTRTPRFLCAASECGATFDNPDWENRRVATYLSHHAAGWIGMSGMLSASDCRSLVRIPEVSAHLFRLIPHTHSGGFRTPDRGRHLTLT